MLLYLHSLGNKKENLMEFNLVDFCNSPNRQNKFYAKFSSYMVFIFIAVYPRVGMDSHIPHSLKFLRVKIFKDFRDFCLALKILILKILVFQD